jgi:hypothetical protein
MFVDPGRNIKRWIESRMGLPPNSGTISDAMGYLANGPGAMQDRIADLLNWVRGGFAPQNRAYWASAYDGGDIGAVPFHEFE